MNTIQAGRMVLAVALVIGIGALAQQNPEGKKDEAKVAQTPVDTLLKNVGAAASRPKALQELVQRLTAGEADTDILMRTDDFVKTLCPMVKNAFDKNTSTLAMEALAVFGKSNAGVVDWFVNETQKGSASSALLSVRGVGKVGAPAKEKAVPVLTAILTNPQTKTSNAALYNEALMARALLGGPFEADIVPEMLKIASLMKDAEAQADMLIAIAQDKDLLAAHAKQIELFVVKVYPLMNAQGFTEKVKDLGKTLVSMKTPSSEKAVFDMMSDDRLLGGVRSHLIGLIKEMYDVPSTQIINAMMVAIEKEASPHNVRGMCRDLASYGANAKPALPALKRHLSALPAKKGSFFHGGEEAKPIALSALRNAIAEIEKAVAEKEKGGGAGAETPKEP